MKLNRDIEREAAQWHRGLKRALRLWAKDTFRRSQRVLTSCHNRKIPLADVFSLAELLKRTNDVLVKRDSEVEPLLNLLSDRKRLNRKAETLRRGSKGQRFLPEFQSYFGLSTNGDISKVADALPGLHVTAKRRPKEHRTTQLMLLAANFFVERTGQPQWDLVRDFLYAAFPELGRIKANTIEKRLEDLRHSTPGWVQVPPTHKLSGKEARKWVMILMQQASQDVLEMEMKEFNAKRKLAKKQRNGKQTPIIDRDGDAEARAAWLRFFRFANRPALTSGEQMRIEPIVRLIGERSINRGWRLVEGWQNWGDAKDVWVTIWREQRAACKPIIETLT